MDGFVSIVPEETENACKLIGKDWMLITAGSMGDGYNTMTASWGAMGVLWNKPVCICFIRPQRFTYSFAESNDYITFSFFDEEYREALRYCGTHSGRDVNKVEECALTAVSLADGKAVGFEESKLVVVCRKLYRGDIEEDSFLDKSLLDNYKNRDYHAFYVCEIVEAYKKIY